METKEIAGIEELTTGDAAGTAGGTSPLGRGIGYAIGFLFGLIANADPFDGNYYGVGA